MARASIRFVEIFCAVVEAGNYTAAAQKLGVTPGAVSRAVTRQEEVFDVRLLQRTTRNMTVTEAGRRYYEQCRAALSLLDQAERSLSQHAEEAVGVVRISAPSTYACFRLGTPLAQFARQHPGVAVELDVNNENVDFTTDNVDLAIRRGQLEDSSLVVRRLEEASAGYFASPEYLARAGTPRSPSELAEHSCILFVLPRTGRPLPWGFVDAERQPYLWPPKGRVTVGGDVLACLELARAGAGIVQAFHFLVRRDVEQGRLVEILEDHAGRSSAFSLVRPARRGESLAVRLLADTIVAHCARPRSAALIPG